MQPDKSQPDVDGVNSKKKPQRVIPVASKAASKVCTCAVMYNYRAIEAAQHVSERFPVHPTKRSPMFVSVSDGRIRAREPAAQSVCPADNGALSGRGRIRGTGEGTEGLGGGGGLRRVREERWPWPVKIRLAERIATRGRIKAEGISAGL